MRVVQVLGCGETGVIYFHQEEEKGGGGGGCHFHHGVEQLGSPLIV